MERKENKSSSFNDIAKDERQVPENKEESEEHKEEMENSEKEKDFKELKEVIEEIKMYSQTLREKELILTEKEDLFKKFLDEFEELEKKKAAADASQNSNNLTSNQNEVKNFSYYSPPFAQKAPFSNQENNFIGGAFASNAQSQGNFSQNPFAPIAPVDSQNNFRSLYNADSKPYYPQMKNPFMEFPDLDEQQDSFYSFAHQKKSCRNKTSNKKEKKDPFEEMKW